MPIRPILALCALLAIAGCVSPEVRLATANIAADPAECRGRSAGACYFENSPVRLVDRPVRIVGRINDFYPTARSLRFVDGRQRLWQAPQGTLTDGASIPLVFRPIVGNPRTPEFINAAALHDAWCGVGNEDGPVYRSRTWQEVHRMFYDTLIVGGTPELKAKVMFAAVWLGGPRWRPVERRTDLTMERLPRIIRQDGMVETRAFIEANNPPMPRLMRYLDWQERRMIERAARMAGGDSAPLVQSPSPGDPDTSPPGDGKGGLTPGGGQGAIRP